MDVNFQVTARTMVMNYFNSHKDMTDDYVMMFSDTYVVWFSKTLQNWKALVSTNVPDGMYYEVTHNGDAQTTYLDVYRKVENIAMPDEALRIETSATGPDEEEVLTGNLAGALSDYRKGEERDFVPTAEKLPPPPIRRYESPNPLIRREEDAVGLDIVMHIDKVTDEPWRAGNLRF